MNDKQIQQVTYEDENGIRWVAACKASVVREDGQGSKNYSVIEIKHIKDDKYGINLFGRDSVEVTVHEDDVVYR